jgi:hypothetical protein
MSANSTTETIKNITTISGITTRTFTNITITQVPIYEWDNTKFFLFIISIVILYFVAGYIQRHRVSQSSWEKPNWKF